MSNKSTATIATMGIDIGKNSAIEARLSMRSGAPALQVFRVIQAVLVRVVSWRSPINYRALQPRRDRQASHLAPTAASSLRRNAPITR
jgi:hypothetical protein